MTDLLHVERGNAKLPLSTAVFSLPAGWTCPGASMCLSRADRGTGKITDGPDSEVRCFAATSERYPKARDSRWRNLDMIKAALKIGAEECADLIGRSLPRSCEAVRIHSGGDFFSRAYLGAWIMAARRCPEKVYYAYTKSLPHWIACREDIPPNLILTASWGGRYDHLIDLFRLRSARIVLTHDEASSRGLAVDHDDGLARNPDVQEFALILHGTQPPGTAASKALQVLRRAGEFGYGAKADKRRERRTALTVV